MSEVLLTPLVPQRDGVARDRSQLAAITDHGVIKVVGGRADDWQGASIEAAIACALPARVGAVARAGDLRVGCIGPRNWVLVAPYPLLADIAARVDADGMPPSGLVVDVSHGRAQFRLSGLGAREVLSAHCPVDLRAAAFAPGQCAATRFGNIACYIDMIDEGAPEAFTIIVDQIYADWTWRRLVQTLA